MEFQTPLIPGRLIQRYKRFLADVKLDTGETVTAHCANPGSMMGLKDPGLKVWLEPNDDPKKKLKYGWRVAQLQNGAWVGVDTSVPNRVVKEALLAGQVAELAAYKTVKPEQKYGTNSRIDFLLHQDGLKDAYVEVKSVTLMRAEGVAEFPDSVTTRGAKHLQELAEVVRQGHKAFMLYLVQHTGCNRFRLAEDIDPAYAKAFKGARSAGVQMLCYGCELNERQVLIDRPLPIHVD